jgi:hypothetical protein
MTNEFNMEVVGVKDALKILNSMDKSLRREITADFKKIMELTVKDAIELVPTDKPPLSGMGRVWITKSKTEMLPWSNVKPDRQIKPWVSGKAIKDTSYGFKKNVGVFGMKWTGPQARLFDMAGKAKPGSPMAQALTEKYGSPSRAMWRAYERNKEDVNGQIEDLVGKVMREANRLIGNI